MSDVLAVLFPVFGLVFIGYAFGVKKILAGTNAKSLNDYVYYIGLPVLLFYQTARTPLDELLHFTFIGAVMISTLLMFILSYMLLKYFYRYDMRIASAGSFAATFSNVAFMGIPLFYSAYGEYGTLPAVIVAIVSNTLVIGTVVVLIELGAKPLKSPWEIISQVIISLFRNPFVGSSIVGLFVAVIGIKLPAPFENLVRMISQSAGPIALIAIGLSMVGVGVKMRLSELINLSALKMILFPLVTFLIAHYIFKLDQKWTGAAVLLTALPTGTLVYVVCQKYELYVTESSSMFVVTTLLSVVTLPVLLYLIL